MNTGTRITLALLAASGLLTAVPAYAGVAGPASVAVQLTIENSCSFTGSGTLDFGTRTAGVSAANIDAQSTGLSLNCTGDSATASINVSGGNNLLANNRRLRLGAAATFTPYELYQDAGRTTKFDPATFQTISGGLTTGTTAIVVYGRIPTGTLLVNGNGINFTDTVQVTVNF